MTKIRVYFDENGQISTDSIVRSLDGSAAPTLTPELLNKARPIDTGEIEAYDPKTGKNITVPDGVNVDMARLNAQIKDNYRNALSKGVFAGEIDPHDNFTYNLLRETARTGGGMFYKLPENMEVSGIATMHALAEQPEYIKAARKITEAAGMKGFMFDENLFKQFVEDHADELKERRDELFKAINEKDKKLENALGEQRDGWGSKIGSGVGSFGALVGLTALGGYAGAAAGIGVMAETTAGSLYKEGVEGGLSDADAANRAISQAIFEAVTERVGLGMLWNSAGAHWAKRALWGFLTEGSEEAVQTLSEDLIMNDVRGKTAMEILDDVWQSGIVGGIVGAPGGLVGGGASINPTLRAKYVKKLKDAGVEEEQANKFLDYIQENHLGEQGVLDAIKEVSDAQVQTALMLKNDPKVQETYQALMKDAANQAKHDIDIRDEIKSRTRGLDENTQNVVADAVQNFANVISDDFGITQREFLESTGLQVNAEQNTQIKFADGTQIDENGNLLDKDGKVLFQRVGKKGATEKELDALSQALEMEKAGYDNDTIKNSTGWARGLDGKMWLETGGDYSILIDNIPQLNNGTIEKSMPLTDIIKTDNFQRYPSLNDTTVVFVNKPKANYVAGFDRKTNSFRVNTAKINKDDRIGLIRALAHEIDHYIAKQEGFAGGSSSDEKIVVQQAKIHENRMIKSLRELGLYDKYKALLDKQGKDKKHYDAVVGAIVSEYDQQDIENDRSLEKKLQKLVADAIIVDKYSKETLDKLSDAEKQKRITEAYANTIGEIYARRASRAAGRNDAALRANPDERNDEALDSALGAEFNQGVNEIVQNEFAEELSAQDDNQDVRGYFDWTNKMQQIIQIMKSGDLDTVLHELGHFFSVNYINMAIESGNTEKIQPLLEYYKIETPSLLIVNDDIQEDLAVKFLSYLKTDQSPRGFRKYFDMAKDWLVRMWDSLKSKGLVQDAELPDEIVRFFDDITIRRPRGLNINSAMNEKTRLKKILHAARTGALDGVSDSDIHTIEELLKAATARIPRMPKSLYNKLWGQLNTQFAETHDLLSLMGVDEKAKYLATSKNGGIKNENDLMDWLREEGFMFGDMSDTYQGESANWDEALRLIGNAKNSYSVDDAMRVQEIDDLRQAQEIARDVLDGRDSYDAMADIDNAKSAIQRVNDAIDRNKAMNKELAADYKKLSAEVRMAKAGTAEMRKAIKSAVSFLTAQDIATDVKAKLMKTLPMVHDSRSLAKWIGEVRDRAEKEYSDLDFRAQRERLKNELSETYTPNKRNIKYDYEHNKLFNDLRSYNMMSAEKAQEEIRQFYDGEQEKDGLSREDQLRKMMLEYRANLPRKQMSGAFMDELISRIQEAKLIGRDAIDAIQFGRGMERMDLREEILDAIDKNKAKKLDKTFAGVADFKSLLNMITNGKIADQFNMVAREIQAGIDAAARQNESIREVLRINERNVSDSPRKNSYEFLKYKAELCEPLDINVSYTDYHGRKVVVGIDNGKKTFSKAHIMDMWNQYKDPKSRELMDKFYGQWQMEQLFSYLTDQDKQTADYLMERLRDIYDMVNPVYVSLYQKDMPHKKIYWPRQSNHEIDHELLERFDGEAREANFTKSRSHGAIPVFKRDVFSNYQAHEKDAQYMVHQAKAFKDAADIFDDSTIKEAIQNKFGKEVVKELSEHLKALSIGGVRKARSSFDTTYNQIAGQIIGSKVNFSPFVMMKQLTSFGAFSVNMPVGRFYAGFATGVMNPRKTYKYMMEHAGDYLRNRYGRGVNETMAAMIDPAKQNWLDKKVGAENRAAWNEFMSRMVRTGDVGAIIYGGYPRLKFLIEETDTDGKPVRTHEQAVEQFIKESEETQQSATNAAQSNWQRGNSMTKVFAMYKTSQIQYFRKVANAYNMWQRGEISRQQFVKTTAIFTAQMAIGYKLMGDLLSAALYGWDDDKDVWDELGGLFGSIITQGFDAFGALGYLANQAFSVISGQRREADLSIVGISDILQTVNNSKKLINGKGDNAYIWVQTVAPLIEGTTGAPVSRYNRVLKKNQFLNYKDLGI